MSPLQLTIWMEESARARAATMLWVHVSRARPSHHRVSPRHICTHVSYLVRSYFMTIHIC